MESFGKLLYDPKDLETKYRSWWVILRCDEGLAAYYRSWIEKEWPCQIPSGAWFCKANLDPPKDSWLITQTGLRMCRSVWGPHISVTRGERPKKNLHLWKKYQGHKITFEYEPKNLFTNGKHWWIQIRSKELENIRVELGLTPQPMYYDRSGSWKVNPFHLTIGHRAVSDDIDNWIWKKLNQEKK